MSPSHRLVLTLAVALGLLTAGAFALQAHDRSRRLGDADLTAQRYVVSRLSTPPPPGDLRLRGHWVGRLARATGIPAPAVRAYARAARSAPRGCDVGWPTLAGIGWVESQHGTLGGRSLGADGRSSSPIVGPALDGRDGFAAIRSTPASALLHGDGEWEHAVGPMQFLPSTWDRYAADGDDDGRADPLDLDDAAATAAGYLCAGGHDLLTGVGWQRAVLSYNHSGEYVDSVYAAASSYASDVS